MESLRDALGALRRESVEQIELCIAAALDTHLSSVQDKTIAACIVLAKLDESNAARRLEEAVPTLCLIDAMLKHSHPKAQKVATECIKMLPAALAPLKLELNGTAAADKAKRFLKRWLKDGKVTQDLHDGLVSALKGELPHVPSEDTGGGGKGPASSATADQQQQLEASEMTASQVTELNALVNTIAKLLSQLPQHRREMYCRVLKPRLNTSLKWNSYDATAPFLRHLCVDVRQEVSKYTSGTGSGGEVKLEGTTAASHLVDKKPQALLQLLETVEKQAQQLHEEETSASSLVTSERDQSIASKYTSPLLTDILGHQSPGHIFGFSSQYIPRNAADSNRRHPPANRNPKLPFQYPAALSKEKGGVCRQWFLTEEAWTTTPDFGQVPFVAPRVVKKSGAQLLDAVAKKRLREENVA